MQFTQQVNAAARAAGGGMVDRCRAAGAAGSTVAAGACRTAPLEVNAAARAAGGGAAARCSAAGAAGSAVAAGACRTATTEVVACRSAGQPEQQLQGGRHQVPGLAGGPHRRQEVGRQCCWQRHAAPPCRRRGYCRQEEREKHGENCIAGFSRHAGAHMLIHCDMGLQVQRHSVLSSCICDINQFCIMLLSACKYCKITRPRRFEHL